MGCNHDDADLSQVHSQGGTLIGWQCRCTAAVGMCSACSRPNRRVRANVCEICDGIKKAASKQAKDASS